jgi:hypothetical protein
VELNKRISDAIPEIVSKLRYKKSIERSAFLGFDACIDNIVRIVRDKNGNNLTKFFSDSDQLGDFLLKLDNKSCGLELETKLSKAGGNMFITGNALGNLGIRVECVGTFGYPEILPVFRTMSSNCSLHTIGDTITATALEFNNSKVIMFDPGPYNNLTWEGIKGLLGIEKLCEMISDKQLIAFVNWSEIDNSSQIWKGFLDDIFPRTLKTGPKAFFLTDFSDCSRRTEQEIQFALKLLCSFKDFFKVTLSLNQNEAALVAKALGLTDSMADEEFVKKLFSLINVDILIIHRTNDALSYDGVSYEKCDTFFCNEPKILTGGGDNFNAGFCYSLLNDLNPFQSLLVANAVSGSYVKTGISPDMEYLIEFIKQESDIL